MRDAATACACGTCPSCSGTAPRPPIADPDVYRQQAIKARLLNRIAASAIGTDRPLAPLRTRDDKDPSIALIDAFAGSLHILAYSAARLSDGGSIVRTQDRDALVNLTRMLGYEPRPALSASTTISFMVNDLPAGPTRALVPAGTRVASIPGQKELPKSFETSRELDARAEWNALRPALRTRPFRVRKATDRLWIAGVATAAKVGDLVLAYMTEQPGNGTTWLAGRISAIERVPETTTPPPREAALFPDRAAPSFTRLQLRSTNVLQSQPVANDVAARNMVIVLGQRAAAFGSNAPNLELLDPKVSGPLEDQATKDWKNLEMLVPDSGESEPVLINKLFATIVFDSAGNPPPEAGKIITRAVEGFRKSGSLKIILGGHSDVEGSAPADLMLSERLATSVADALVGRDIPRGSIEVKALGNTQPVAPGKNTRVEVTFVQQLRDNVIDLDAVYADTMAGRIVLFETDRKESPQEIGAIGRVSERSRTDFGLSAKVSRVWLDGIDLSNETGFNKRVRETSIFIETARETLLQAPSERILPQEPYDRITFLGAVDLPVGRRTVLRGELCGTGEGALAGEVVTVAEIIEAGEANSTVRFERSISSRFRSVTLSLLGNSVQATHGEAAGVEPELLGSSDIRRLAPRYRLKASPLSYVPAANPSGFQPALEVRVSDRLYDELPTLWGVAAGARAYTVRPVEDGKTELQFAGRLKTGTNNVTAAYRVGSGKTGNLAAGRLSTILTPVLGIKSASNPLPAEGGSDAESIEDMRASAPQSIRTLDRVVSLSDFEVFARRFRGIGKALATEVQMGMRKIVLLTIATTELKAPAAGSDLVEGLDAALKAVAVPGRIFRIAGFDTLSAELAIAFASDPSLRRADVEESVRAALSQRFSPSVRQFGQPLTRSEVLFAVQSVEGVIAARISGFALAGSGQEPGERLLSPAPAISGSSIALAGLLSVDIASVTFEDMRP